MKIGLIDTLFFDEKKDIGLYKIGDFLIIERVVKCLKMIGIDKLYMLINLENYSAYKYLIKSELLECIFCDNSEKNLEEIIKGFYSFEDCVLVVPCNIFIGDDKVIGSFIDSFLASGCSSGVLFDSKNENCLGIYRGDSIGGVKEEGFACMSNFIEKIIDVDDYLRVNKQYNRKICLNHMNNGVDIIDVDNTYIGENVLLGKGVLIYPNNYIYNPYLYFPL